MITSIVSRVLGRGRSTGATTGRPVGGTATGGSRSQDEAIGRGVRSVLGKLTGRRR
ncbi:MULTISPECIES: hypothetical protein [unclassified Nocardioides]|uniref:hypothetical protein n=1 Tax=unclassified Nocardioides TaxID=2615069 RepID=UPI000B132335|nr:MULTISPECIES: hypothetical protein [unclassified Nocardioides]